MINKYPYFFIYRYKDARDKYRRYCEGVDINCQQRFGLSLDELLALSEHSDEQQLFIDNYYEYMPVTISDSPMNLLCRYIESIKLDILKQKKTVLPEDLVQMYKRVGHPYTDAEKEAVVDCFKVAVKAQHCAKTAAKKVDKYAQHDWDQTKLDYERIDEEIAEICSDVYAVVNILVDYYYIDYPKSNKEMLWAVYGQYLAENVAYNAGDIYFPIPDPEGDIEYMKKRFSLKKLEV